MARPPQPTAVRTVRVAPLDVPLLEPFGIARGSQEVARNAVVAVELVDGSVGLGEAAPFPAYNGETQAGALRQLRQASGLLAGHDAAEWSSVAARVDARGSALCALESALLDALFRSRGQPLWRAFGGSCAPLETDMTITTGGVGHAEESARGIRSRGIRVIKVKVGGAGSAAADAARVERVARVAPASPLILDANGSLSREKALELAGELRRMGIVPALLEQWLEPSDLEGMRILGLETGWKVAADESVATAEDARRAARAGAASVFNVKLMKSGIAEALRVVEVARDAGIGLMIGGNVETVLAMTVSACFAAGLGGFDWADLDTPLFMASNPFRGGYRLEGGFVRLEQLDAGHGVSPRGLLF